MIMTFQYIDTTNNLPVLFRVYTDDKSLSPFTSDILPAEINVDCESFLELHRYFNMFIRAGFILLGDWK